MFSPVGVVIVTVSPLSYKDVYFGVTFLPVFAVLVTSVISTSLFNSISSVFVKIFEAVKLAFLDSPGAISFSRSALYKIVLSTNFFFLASLFSVIFQFLIAVAYCSLNSSYHTLISVFPEESIEDDCYLKYSSIIVGLLTSSL